MRKYYTESVGNLLKKMKKELNIVKLYNIQEEMKKCWSTLPDPTLQRMEVSFRIEINGRLEVVASSTVAFNYLRRQRSLIATGFADVMEQYSLTELVISL